MTPEANSTYCPPVFEPQVSSAAWEIKRGLFHLSVERRLSFENQDEVSKSLAEFTSRMNGGEINEVMSEFLKPSQEPVEGKFVLDHGMRREWDSKKELYYDGKFSITLGLQQSIDSEPIWLAVTSFLNKSDINTYTRSDSFQTEDLATIIQLQGPGPNKTGYSEAISILNRYRWEQALVGIAALWCSSNNVPMLNILPSHLNVWAQQDEEKLKKLHVRYDVTAQRSGFTMLENGLWGLSLLGYEVAYKNMPTSSPDQRELIQ